LSKQIKEQSARETSAYEASHQISGRGIDEVPQNLDSNKECAHCQPQRRRRNHPIADNPRARASRKKRIPAVFPSGVRLEYACGLSFQASSSAVPGQVRVIAESKAIHVPKTRKIPIKVRP